MLKQNPPRLEDEQFSPELRDLVAVVLEPKPEDRPSMAEICAHERLAGSEKLYPTSSLKELVETYFRWEHSGGQRSSLFIKYGAARPEIMNLTDDDEDDEWNFSTTAGFDQLQARAAGDFSTPTTAQTQFPHDNHADTNNDGDSDSQDEYDGLFIATPRHNLSQTSLDQGLYGGATVSSSLHTSDLDEYSTPRNFFPPLSDTSLPNSFHGSPRLDVDDADVEGRTNWLHEDNELQNTSAQEQYGTANRRVEITTNSWSSGRRLFLC
jgi:hypothetical protein